MGVNQGLYRMSGGISRRLRPTELARGSVYISMDKSLSKILDTRDFEVHIAGEVFRNRKIDPWGRIQIPKRYLQALVGTAECHIRLVSRHRLEIRPTSRSDTRYHVDTAAST